MSFAIASLIILAVIALIAIPILVRVFGEAARRNPNRPGGEGSAGPEGDQSRRSDPGGE